jgi:SPP1 family predicted phage head-tail adaptor
MRRTLDIGALNKRITFLKLDPEAEDDLGQLTNGFTEIGTYWGSLYPVRGQEFYEVQKIQGRVTHKCYVRFYESISELDSNNFLRYGGKTYSIESVNDVDLAHKYLEIYCSEHINKEEIDDYVPPTPPTPPDPEDDEDEEVIDDE